MLLICVECGEEIKDKDAEGSMRHPYCKRCFKKVFDNDYDKYWRFLEDTHFKKRLRRSR